MATKNGIDLATTDAILTTAALKLGQEDTARAVRRWVAGIDPDGTLDDAAGRPRIFRMATSTGGRVYLSGHLDPVGGEHLHTALAAIMNGNRPADDVRTHGQRQGDALVELARRALRAGDLPTAAAQPPRSGSSSTGSPCAAPAAPPASPAANWPSPGRSAPRPPAGWPATPA